MHIRELEDDDWDRLWPVLRDTVTAGETYAYPEDLDAETARPWWSGEHVVVAVDGEELLGSAKAGPNRPGRGAHVATASFVVAAEARGRGVGRALGEHVIDWARDNGYRAVQFNAVVETNTVAVRLWQSLGFQILGTVPQAFDSRAHGLVGLHVMHRSL